MRKGLLSRFQTLVNNYEKAIELHLTLSIRHPRSDGKRSHCSTEVILDVFWGLSQEFKVSGKGLAVKAQVLWLTQGLKGRVTVWV